MSKKSKKQEEAISNSSILKRLEKEDQFIIERIKELALLLKTKYNLSQQDIFHLISDKESLIPVSIFTKKLRILETLTKYLKEELELSYHQIGILLNRDERNIWHTYNSSRKKYPNRLKIIVSKYFIPVSIFQNKLGAL